LTHGVSIMGSVRIDCDHSQRWQEYNCAIVARLQILGARTEHAPRAHTVRRGAASPEMYPEAAPQDRVIRLESASMDAKHLERQSAALRKNLKTKLKGA
jgi:hypothetical protein